MSAKLVEVDAMRRDVTGVYDAVAGKAYGFLRGTAIGDVYVPKEVGAALAPATGDVLTGVASPPPSGNGAWFLRMVTAHKRREPVRVESTSAEAPQRDVVERRLLDALVSYPWPADAEPTVREARKLAAHLAQAVLP